ncbi:MAG: hypothetical protein ACRC35_11405 [Angustibacter sp.]
MDPSAPAPVVVIGVGGVRWADVTVDAAPRLAGLARTAAVGAVAVRSVRPSTCPVDGWLALSAGRRAADAAATDAADERPLDLPCRPPRAIPAAGGAGTVPDWPRYLQAARGGTFDARPGLLAGSLAEAGRCATAIGPGAAVALATSSGRVPRYRLAAAEPQGLAGAVRQASTSCPLTVVDAGAVRDEDDAPASPEQGAGMVPGDRPAQLRTVDTRVGAVLDAAPAGARVVVVSLADAGRTPRLQLIAASGPGFAAGWLRTSATRQDALVQATDLTPTVLSLLGIPGPPTLVGSPLTTLAAPADAPADAGDRMLKVLDLGQAADRVQPLVEPFFRAWVIAQLVVYGAAALVLRSGRATRPRRWLVRAVVGRLALVFAAVPAGTYLANTVPWWRGGHPLAVVSAVTAGYVVVIAAAALLGPWRRHRLGPAGAVAGITVAVLAVDVLTGSQLQLSSLMGVQPVVAGRFYGFSNVAFALLATGALLLATALADQVLHSAPSPHPALSPHPVYVPHPARLLWQEPDRDEPGQPARRRAAAVVALIGVVVVALDVSPWWGSDLGGPLALVPAFALLALGVLGSRLSARRLLAIGAATVLLLVAVAVVDWLRPAADRTHLGRFVQTAVDGGAWQVVSRKAGQNLDILLGSWMSMLVPVVAALFALVLLRPDAVRAHALHMAYQRSPVLRQGVCCLLLMWAIGFAVNDSGTAIPAVGAALAAPLILAISLRVGLPEQGAQSDVPGHGAGGGPTPTSPSSPAAPSRRPA